MAGQLQHNQLWGKVDDADAKHFDPSHFNMSDHSNKVLTGLCGQG